MKMKHYNIVLTIAGSDSGGGAGVQADIKTISACGCYAASAITAVTVQNTLGVNAVSAVPVDILEGQIDAVLSDIGADAVKIGMLHSSEVVRCVRKMLDKYNVKNVLATRSEYGMSLVQPEDGVIHIPTKAQEVFDVSGAGDTVISVFALGISGGLKSVEAAYLANLAASVVVAKLGTYAVSNQELQKVLTDVE